MQVEVHESECPDGTQASKFWKAIAKIETYMWPIQPLWFIKGSLVEKLPIYE